MLHRGSILLSCLLLISCLNLISEAATTARQESNATSVAGQTAATDFECEIGFNGKSKLGHWLPVTIKADSPDLFGVTHFRITALDGDETPASIEGKLIKVKSNSKSVYQAWARLGRTYGTIKIELLDGPATASTAPQPNLVAEKIFGLQESSSGIEVIGSASEIVLTLEPLTGGRGNLARTIESVTLLAGPGAGSQIITVEDLSSMPVNWFALQGVESILLTTSDAEKIKSADPRVWSSIYQWIQNGGHFMVSACSENIDLFEAGGPLEKFTPGTVRDQHSMRNSREIEGFSSSREQLIPRGGDPVSFVRLQDVDGKVMLEQSGDPLVIAQAVGFGEIMFVAVDLDSPQMTEWAGFLNFLQIVAKRKNAAELMQGKNEKRRGSSVRHFGYRDLIGQLKVPLEQFSLLKFIPFMLIAALIALYILCIGPGDYFFLNKLVKKPELTWITFPLITALFCGLAWWISDYARPETIQLNQLEIVDFDAESKRVRGTCWTNLYSPNGTTADVGLKVTDPVAKMDSSVVTWLGLPGDGLGGMQNKANPGLYRSGYRFPFEFEAADDNVARATSSAKEMTLQVSSTKPLFGQWHGESNLSVNSRLKVTDRLEGTFTNPFDVPLVNCRLLFEDWAYLIKGSLEPGKPIHLRSETTEKTLKAHLTRRRSRDDDANKSQNLPWDPTNTNLPRIADMLMFYDSTGGQDYTGLTHGFHKFIDMTPNLQLDRAILVGQFKKKRLSEFTIDGTDASEMYDTNVTIVRVLLPVDMSEDSRRD